VGVFEVIQVAGLFERPADGSLLGAGSRGVGASRSRDAEAIGCDGSSLGCVSDRQHVRRGHDQARQTKEPALRTRLMDLYLTLDAYPEVPQVLRRLQDSGRRTAILSIGSPRMLNAAVEHVGIASLIDAVIVARSPQAQRSHLEIAPGKNIAKCNRTATSTAGSASSD
jgi:phosphoglycolate phosphatase-like HAD superfamily hydrolase